MRETVEITGEIVDTAYRPHTRLGPGLLESVYEALLGRGLEQRGLRAERQETISCEFDGLRFDEGFRADLIVEGRILIELKSVEKLAPVHAKQVLTDLKLLDLPVGFVINCGAGHLRDGLQRIVNGPSSLRVPRTPARP